MRYRKLAIPGLVIFATLVVSIGSARAQTTAIGPYYATPSWDQTFACTSVANCPRFVVLSNFGGQAVLDRETGLVWERSPSTSPVVWAGARFVCRDLTKGNRKGWRLPTVDELTTLVDPSVTNLALPPGHPFQNVQPNLYWSTTSVDAGFAASVDLFDGNVFSLPKTSGSWVWCVRGGQGVDVQ
jgi:hypothetical protein